MVCNKILLFALFYFPLTSFATRSQSKEFQYIKAKRIVCTTSPVWVHENVSCFAKALSRNSSGLNFRIEFKKPLNYFSVRFTFFFRYGTIMRQVLQTPPIDWCGVMRVSTSNPLFAEMVKIVRNIEPTVVHQCPYQNIIVVNKVPDVSSMPSIFSAGHYKLWINATDRSEKLIFNVEFIIEWVSSERNSFG